MAKKAVKLDPDDGLIVGEVGQWATEKHDRLRKYIEASRGARAKFLRLPSLERNHSTAVDDLICVPVMSDRPAPAYNSM